MPTYQLSSLPLTVQNNSISFSFLLVLTKIKMWILINTIACRGHGQNNGQNEEIMVYKIAKKMFRDFF